MTGYLRFGSRIFVIKNCSPVNSTGWQCIDQTGRDYGVKSFLYANDKMNCNYIITVYEKLEYIRLSIMGNDIAGNGIVIYYSKDWIDENERNV
jgi:hypothetical protein